MAKRHLEIYNFGPIKEAVLDFTRVNVFIGPQSVGKSCVLKTACHCAWAEKRLMISKDVSSFQKDNFFFEQLLSFHKLKGYDNDPNLRIVYNTSFLQMEYNHKDKLFTCTFIDQNSRLYKRAKLSYIPAERNVIATIPNWISLPYENNNTRSFMSDWVEARKEFVSNILPIPELKASYFFDDKGDVDMVKVDGMDKALPMSNISSGMQSLIPMSLYVHYLTHGVFKNKVESVSMNRDNVKLMHQLYDSITKGSNVQDSYEIKVNNEFLSFSTEEEMRAFQERYDNYTKYQHSDIFVEEPEENLYPKTQAETVINILCEIFAKNKEHSLFMATHSPYILYALNNAILANIVKKSNVDKDEIADISSSKPEFDAKDISVWQLRDGEIVGIDGTNTSTIQDKEGLVRKNFFDDVMKEVMTDFNNLLGYK